MGSTETIVNLITLLLFLPHSKFHLSGAAAVRRPLFSRLFVQLVRCRGLGSRPAGQPHPEGAAAEGPIGHQSGEAPRVFTAAVHQHPLPGGTLIVTHAAEVTQALTALGYTFLMKDFAEVSSTSVNRTVSRCCGFTGR